MNLIVISAVLSGMLHVVTDYILSNIIKYIEKGEHKFYTKYKKEIDLFISGMMLSLIFECYKEIVNF